MLWSRLLLLPAVELLADADAVELLAVADAVELPAVADAGICARVPGFVQQLSSASRIPSGSCDA